MEDEEDVEDRHRGENEHENEGEDTDDEDEGGSTTGGGGGTGGGGTVIPSLKGCTLNVGGVSTNYTKCYSMGAGTTYFSLNGNTLSAGFKVKTAGWSALAVGKPHQGASAVWSSSCGATCSKASGITMRSFSPSQIAPPSLIPFANMKSSKTATGEHSVSFTMPWPGAVSSIQVALANGAGAKNQHGSIPKKYTVNKADITATALG